LIVYARSTTIQAQPSSIDAGIALVRDVVMPALQKMDGFVGLSLLVDRKSGRCIATSSWESERAMHCSGEQVLALQKQAAETFGGPATVERWEIAVLHRGHHAGAGACARVTWLKVRAHQFEAAIDSYRTSVLPAIQKLEGFCSTSLMIDRGSGHAVSSSTFDSPAAMEQNGDNQERSLRTAWLRDLGADQYGVGEFELAIAHLRAPELV
jgi:quinol monooxygenase YgiN